MTALKCVAWALALGLVAAPALRADDETKVPLDKVPAAVKKAVEDKFPGATLVQAETEKEDGKTVYEIGIKFKGATIEVTVTPEGTVTCVEKTVELKDVPKAVAAALEAKYPKAEVKLVEEVTKGEKVYFEFQIVTADKKKMEVEFDPTGKFLAEEKKDGEKDEKKPEPKKP